MEAQAQGSSTAPIAYPVVDIDLTWFFGLRDAVLSCFTQSRMELEKVKRENEENPLPWALSSTITVLMSDADMQRKSLMEYFINTNGARALLELLEHTTSYKVGEKAARILRELVSQRSGKQRNAVVKQCVEADYLAICVSILRKLAKGTGSKSSSNAVTTPVTPTCSISPVVGSLEDCSVSRTDPDVVSENSRDCITNITALSTICNGYNDLGNGATITADFIWFLAGVTAKGRVANILGKDKVMQVARKAFAVINHQPNQKMLMFMESLAFLTRDRKNSVRFLKAGLLVKVLGCFRHWAHWKGKGLLKLSKYVINIYTHLARTKSGKPALKNSDAINLIRVFCEQCPPERSFDDVIMRACSMIHVCYGKDTLPLENLECPIKFEVPSISDGLVEVPIVESGSSSDEDDPAEGEEIEDEDSMDSDNDNDNDDNSDNDELCDNDDVEEGTSPKSPLKPPSRRNSRETPQPNPETLEKIMLDKTARFSYFFREFSPHYARDIKKETDSQTSIMEKLEASISNCILLEDFSEALHGPDSKKDVKLESTSRTDMPRLCSYTFPTATHKYSWTSRHGAKLPKMENLRRLYFEMANNIHHVSPFVKIAYPDVCFGLSGRQVESLCANAERSNIRKKVYASMARVVNEHPGFRPKIVYSLDELIEMEQSTKSSETTSSSKAAKSGKPSSLGNLDENEVGRYDPKSPLSFEARFECGNLRKAVQIAEHEYDLFLTSDINSSRHNQWFYFQVANVLDDTFYTFNIVNCIKTNSLFNYGMQPVVFSVMDAIKHRPGWVRSGTGVCYFKNGYKCIGKKSVKTYHTLSFTLNFQNKGDIVYIAYYIPFTYTRLMVEIHNLLSTVKHSEMVHCRYDVLCKSLDGNDIPLLTVTGPIAGRVGNENNERVKVQDREVIFITSRVHPGETNASWVMMGILRKLMVGNQVEDLLNRYIFKIVPMLNVEGVVNGCHRSGLTSQDLNRCWKTPNEILHPSIYGTKMLVGYCCKVRGRQPTLFLDLHGHSRRKNAFFYGCSYARSWNQEDRITPENPQKLYALAESMAVHCPYFIMHFCHYDVRKSRETTARVAIWREFGIPCSFTLECSYCGCDRGQFKGITFGSGQLWEIGEGLCEAIQTMDMKMQSIALQHKLNIYEEPVAVIESFRQ